MSRKLEESIVKDKSGLACLGAITLVPILFVVNSLLAGWVGGALWAWFVVPLFHVPSLLWWQAVGLAICVRFFTYQGQASTTKTDKEDRNLVAEYFGAISYYPITWFLAWVFHSIWH
jgi:hypothetical protein